jgi:hypothetical protein
VITEDRMRTLFAAANPVPDEDALVIDERDVTAYLANLEERSSEVTKLDTKQTSVPGRRRPSTFWLAAAVAVVVLGVPVVAELGDEDLQPAVPTSEEVAETFVEGLESLDAGSVEGLLTEEATAMYLATFGYDETQQGSIEGLWEWAAIYGMSYRFEGCSESSMTGGPPPADSPGDRGTFFTCHYELENDWTRAIAQSPMAGQFRLEVADGQIVWLVEDFPWDELEPAWRMVIEWVQTEHPGDYTTMFIDGPPGELALSAKLTPESLSLWREYTPQIIESLSN